MIYFFTILLTPSPKKKEKKKEKKKKKKRKELVSHPPSPLFSRGWNVKKMLKGKGAKLAVYTTVSTGDRLGEGITCSEFFVEHYAQMS